MSQIQVIVVTPEATVVDAQTSFVTLPFHDGELGVAANHAPLIGRLGVGEMRFESDGKTRRFYIDGGFAQIADNVVSVMAERAMAAQDMDVEEAKQQLTDAAGQAASGEEVELREKRVAQARAMVRVAERA